MAYKTILVENNPVNVLESFSQELNQDQFNIQSVITRDMGGFWSAKFGVLNPRKNEALQMLHNGPGRSVKFFNERSICVWEGFISKVTLSTGAASAFNDIRPVANDVWVRYRDFTTGNLSRSAHAIHTNSQNKYGQKDWVLSGGQLRSSVADQKAENYLDLNFWATPQLDNFEIGGAGGGDVDLQTQCLGWWHTLDWRVYNQTILANEANAAAVVEDIIGTFTILVPNSLKVDMEAWWTLDESSAGIAPVVRDDSHGTNDLTDNGTVASIDGRVISGGDFVPGDITSLSIADNPSLSFADEDFTISTWVYLDAKPGAMWLVSKWRAAPLQLEYSIFFDNGTNRYHFAISNNGVAVAVNLPANTFGIPALGAWHNIVAWHDSVGNTANIEVNNGGVDSVGYALGCNDNTATFGLGALPGPPPTNHLDGRMDETGVWRRILTAGERTLLYNGGNGIGYRAIGATTRVGGIGDFIASSDIGSNATQVAQEYDADRRAGGIIKSIADLGDVNGNVWIAGVGLDREFYFKPAAPPTEV